MERSDQSRDRQPHVCAGLGRELCSDAIRRGPVRGGSLCASARAVRLHGLRAGSLVRCGRHHLHRLHARAVLCRQRDGLHALYAGHLPGQHRPLRLCPLSPRKRSDGQRTDRLHALRTGYRPLDPALCTAATLPPVLSSVQAMCCDVLLTSPVCVSVLHAVCLRDR
jgi:hypothetical protein